MAKGSNLSLSPPKESQESTIPTPAPAVSSLLSTEDSDTSSGQLLWALHLKHTQSTGQGAKIQNVLGTLKYPEGAGHRNIQSDLDTVSLSSLVHQGVFPEDSHPKFPFLPANTSSELGVQWEMADRGTACYRQLYLEVNVTKKFQQQVSGALLQFLSGKLLAAPSQSCILDFSAISCYHSSLSLAQQPKALLRKLISITGTMGEFFRKSEEITFQQVTILKK